MHWPDIDEDDTRWESRLLRFLSPPEQTAESRRQFYFSLFYTVTHVFALMNVALYWTVLVPNGHAHWPKGDGNHSSGYFVIAQLDDGHSKYHPFKGIMAEGWFKAFCLLNLYLCPAVLTVVESLFLNSMRRQEVGTGRFVVVGEIC